MKDPSKVSDAKIGDIVSIATGYGAKEGRILKVLTTRDNPKGIKVELETGERGRIITYVKESELKAPLPEIKKVEDKKVLKEVQDHTVIKIRDTDIEINERLIFSEDDNKDFEVVTKFFNQTYIKKIKNDVYGIVVFKVRAFDLNIAIYKINLYLKTYCVSKDVKYEVIKSTSR